jgi:hypothetical protein
MKENPKRFNITWRENSASYGVSIPNFDGGEVVLASEYDKVAAALREAVGHLEYCSYGDSWERECADEEGLPDKLSKILEEIV